MNLLALSDWRVQRIEDLYRLVDSFNHRGHELDFILYAGDDLSRFIDEDTNHFQQVGELADTDVGFVRGNDDLPAEFNLGIESERVHDLHRTPQRKGNYLFLGQEGAVGQTSLGFVTYTENEARSHLDRLYTGHEQRRVILVTHTPPYGVLDLGQRYGEQRIGSRAVAEFAENVEPDLVVCGHVHQFGGCTKECSFGPVVNVASHDHRNADARFATIKVTSFRTSVTHATIEERLGDPLTKIVQVGASRAQCLREHGFENVGDFTWDRRPDLLEVEYIGETVADQMIGHAEAYRTDQPNILDPDQIAAIRARNPILLDIETNLARDRVWLVGIYDYREDTFKQFFDPDVETAVCDAFVDYLTNRDDTVVAYYAGQGFDEHVLTHRIETHGFTLPAKSVEWVDICQLARHAIFVPDTGHDLNTVAAGLGYKFTHPNVTGFEVGSAYSAYLADETEPDWDRYREYNRDDVLAVKHILDVVANEPKESIIETGN